MQVRVLPRDQQTSEVRVIKWSEKLVKVSGLRPFERNPRKMSEDYFAKLKKSLSEMDITSASSPRSTSAPLVLALV
jgi:hypothetical protein